MLPFAHPHSHHSKPAMPDHKLQCPVSVLCHAVLAKKKINPCSFHFSLSVWIILWSLPFHSQNLNFNSLHCLSYFPLKVNLLTPKSDEHLISPYIITPESNIKVMRIKEMIAYLLNKLSLSATGHKERGSDNWVLSYFLVDISFSSHNLWAWECIDIERRH